MGCFSHPRPPPPPPQLLSLELLSKKSESLSYCTAPGTLPHVMWQPGWEGSLGEDGYMYIHTAESLCCTPETTTALLTGYTLIKNKKFKKISEFNNTRPLSLHGSH